MISEIMNSMEINFKKIRVMPLDALSVEAKTSRINDR